MLVLKSSLKASKKYLKNVSDMGKASNKAFKNIHLEVGATMDKTADASLQKTEKGLKALTKKVIGAQGIWFSRMFGTAAIVSTLAMFSRESIKIVHDYKNEIRKITGEFSADMMKDIEDTITKARKNSGNRIGRRRSN